MKKKDEGKIFLGLMVVFIILVAIFTYKLVTNIEVLTTDPCSVCENTTGQKCYQVNTHGGRPEHNFTFNLSSVNLTLS